MHRGNQALAAFIVVGLTIAAKGQTAESDRFREAVVGRLTTLQNVTATCESVVSYLPPVLTVRVDGSEIRVKTGSRTSSNVFRYLGGRALYDSQLSEATKDWVLQEKLPDLLRDIQSYEIDRVEEFVIHPGDRHGVGIINDRAKLPQESVLDLALGLRCYAENEWLTAERVRTGVLSPENGELMLSLKDSRGLYNRWVFDHARPDQMLSYRRESRDGKVALDVACSNFADVGGLSLPRTVERRNFSVFQGKRYIAKRIQISNVRYIIGDRGNVPAAYRIVWDNGSNVKDERVPAQFLIRHGPEPLDDAKIFAAVQRTASSPPHSRGRSVSLWLRWIIGGVPLLVLYCVVVLRRRRRPRTKSSA